MLYTIIYLCLVLFFIVLGSFYEIENGYERLHYFSCFFIAALFMVPIIIIDCIRKTMKGIMKFFNDKNGIRWWY